MCEVREEESGKMPGKANRAKNCTVLIHNRRPASKDAKPATQDELCKKLESSDPAEQISAAKEAILLLLNGEHLPRLPMTVIRFCINTKDKTLKKLLMM